MRAATASRSETVQLQRGRRRSVFELVRKGDDLVVQVLAAPREQQHQRPTAEPADDGTFALPG